MKKYNKSDKITIITTGSQGEPMAGLSRIAYGTHRNISIENDDLFIISASPIPGNDKLVSRVINQLFRKGVEVIYEDLEDIHVSGHAYKEELKLIHTLTKPKYFMPVHGEYRHLKHHSDLAVKLGMDKSNVFTLETGQVLEISKDKAIATEKVHTGVIFVDGIGVGDVGNIVLRDRQMLSENGMILVVFSLESTTGALVGGPDIITRGFVYVRESEDLVDEIREYAKEQIEKLIKSHVTEWSSIKAGLRQNLCDFVYKKTKRNPMILPIITEVKIK